jgi:hypothetical protein
VKRSFYTRVGVDQLFAAEVGHIRSFEVCVTSVRCEGEGDISDVRHPRCARGRGYLKNC